MTSLGRQGVNNFGQNRKRLQALCDDWNRLFPVGAPVDLRKDNGEILRTVTRSNAEVLEGHSAVIWLKGVVGCYLLERVAPVGTNTRIGP
jgi:hypothetical protein